MFTPTTPEVLGSSQFNAACGARQDSGGPPHLQPEPSEQRDRIVLDATLFVELAVLRRVQTGLEPAELFDENLAVAKPPGAQLSRDGSMPPPSSTAVHVRGSLG